MSSEVTDPNYEPEQEPSPADITVDTSYVTIGGMDFDTKENSFLSDRVFRQAWEMPEGGNVVQIDMVLAREIWRENIRRVRKKAFEALDAEFMLALERGQDTSEIAARKQALRDAPAHPDIEKAQTPEELKLVQPAGLEVKAYGY